MKTDTRLLRLLMYWREEVAQGVAKYMEEIIETTVNSFHILDNLFNQEHIP